MKRLIWMFLILVLALSMIGCARVKRIANDINWVVLDGEPSKEN